MKRALAFLCGVCIAAAQAYADPKVDAVDRIVIPVSDLARASGFYTVAEHFTLGVGLAVVAFALAIIALGGASLASEGGRRRWMALSTVWK